MTFNFAKKKLGQMTQKVAIMKFNYIVQNNIKLIFSFSKTSLQTLAHLVCVVNLFLATPAQPNSMIEGDTEQLLAHLFLFCGSQMLQHEKKGKHKEAVGTCFQKKLACLVGIRFLGVRPTIFRLRDND